MGRSMALLEPHAAIEVVLVDPGDGPPGNRIYTMRDAQQRRRHVSLTGEELDSLVEWWVQERGSSSCPLGHTLASIGKVRHAHHDGKIRELRDAIVWALGETDFRERRPGEGPFYWRRELRTRAGLDPPVSGRDG